MHSIAVEQSFSQTRDFRRPVTHLARFVSPGARKTFHWTTQSARPRF